MTIRTLNPYTNQIEKSFATVDDLHISATIHQADEAFQAWSQTSYAERAALLLKVADLLESKSDEYAQLMTKEMGKLHREGIGLELPLCAQICRYYAQNAEEFLAPEPIKDISAGSAYIVSRPVGIIYGVMPWNFPFYQVIRFIAPNVMAGNGVVFKHASNVPQCAQAITELFEQAGFPKNLVNHLFISSSQSEVVIANPCIQGVSLTGSEKAGSSVAALAGKHLKKVVMELGGNDPFIVLADADINKAVELAVIAKMFNSGQVCISAKRFIIEDAVYDSFMSKFTAILSSLKPGDPMSDETGYAPVVNVAERDHLISQIQTAISQGAELVLGGEAEPLPGAWLKPTILAGVTPNMDVFDQELFGPIAIVYRVQSAQEAIELANNSSYGLSSAVISENVDKAHRVADQLHCGASFINTFSMSEACLPFGGIKSSGFGRELGRLGIDEFVNKKLVRTL
ncbi:NAD-dependent succinate-semialdehyde dehydrogenase [Vibrio sp. ZSDZ34]|uniref:NAD-dependent succinate-semialdehyde dehydrogenase n=1 Tax=Vibrio gelatinilyticus TaxID=2893468 RepID=A0A9X2AVI9_9VIBR|nr:NAD-dependent succinate-semialdehyde dehydrogenase [Vibrio gelatinilyticus]MCJ2376914.1 NAD-dependent succinate-semialdehyde dehydrogenase [Vibrio gelatinilyticus]